MRVMVFVKGDPETEAGVMPTRSPIREMTEYNEQLVKAGIMLDGGGLQPTSRAARVRWGGGKPPSLTVRFRSRRRSSPAIGCGRLIPRRGDRMGQTLPATDQSPRGIEIRPLFEDEDFGEALTPDLRSGRTQCAGKSRARNAHVRVASPSPPSNVDERQTKERNRLRVSGSFLCPTPT